MEWVSFLARSPEEWTWPQFGVFAVAVFLAAAHVVDLAIPLVFGSVGRIPVRGKHLDKLTSLDNAFVNFNLCLTVLFVYHLDLYCWSHVPWALADATLANTLGALVGFYVVYDLVYTLFHRALHHRSVYHLVHKHHHRQHAPTRGNRDAMNVHPFEFACGEYLHLLCVWLVPCHALAVAAFLVLNGFLATLNHTRFDVRLPSKSVCLYATAFHDLHHHQITYNYGQYSMLWDYVMGSMKPA